MANKTLKEQWDEQGKRVEGGEWKGGWYIFIHVENSKDPNYGYVSKWSFVVTTDMKYCNIFDLIEEERVPKSFSSEKKARQWWRENKEKVIKLMHDCEEDHFDKFEVNICKAVANFSITTQRKQ